MTLLVFAEHTIVVTYCADERDENTDTNHNDDGDVQDSESIARSLLPKNDVFVILNSM